MAKGRFITVEGPDGAGKSTQMLYLVEALKKRGYTVVQTREPGGTALAERIRSMVLETQMRPITELLLFAAARSDHVDEVIKPAIERGEVVVCDRFTDSTYAYQGSGRNLIGEVMTLEQLVLGDFKPNYTLFFDVTLEESLKRVSYRKDNNLFDNEEQKFKKAVYIGFLQRVLDNPDRMVRIDAMKTVGEIRDDIERWIDDVFVKDYEQEDVEQEPFVKQG